MRARRLFRIFSVAPLVAALVLGPVACEAGARLRPTTSAKAAELSDVLKAKRPKDGEWFGLYLLGKKVGYLYVQLELLPGSTDKARSTNDLYFRAEVANRVSERHHREVRIYEAKPNGRLLSIRVEQSGDGGTQTLEGTNTPNGLHIVRTRPGQPEEERKLPPSPETIEAADQPRVALLLNAPQEHVITDGTDLNSYRVTSKVEKGEERLIGGVPVKLQRVTTVSQKENVPATALVTSDGEVVEIDMGGAMRVVAESEETAKRLDKVEVFGLTRVVLPNHLAEARRRVPGEVKLVVSGMPERFHRKSTRQSYRVLPGGRTEITIRAEPPAKARRTERPVRDPSGGKYLEPTLTVESDHPEIRALATQLVEGDKGAWEAAKKISSWVHENLTRDYGASADRATDVLRQRKGDCTEHALLAVALMRAAGIPARRVDGLVYLANEDGVPALYWHEWVEAFVGEWTQMDPTFNQSVADATHLALGEEGGAEITPLIGTLKVAEVR